MTTAAAASVLGNPDLMRQIYAYDTTYHDVYRECIHQVPSIAAGRHMMNIARELVSTHVCRVMREIGYELEAVTGFWHHYLDASWYPEPALLTWLSLVNNGNHLSQLTVECQFGKPHYSVPEDFEVTFFDVEYDQEAQCMVYDWHCIRPANDNPEDDYYE